MSKVILVSIDGMRPDGVLQCGHPFVQKMMEIGSYALDARTVFPSVTLPCHMSMFHSVPPQRHGVTTNTYTPPVRPVNGLFEQVHAAGKSAAMYYGWEPLKDISRPGSLTFASYINAYADEHTDGKLTACAMDCIEKYRPDFVFLYMVETDEKGGHDSGWMTPTYLQYIHDAIENVRKVWETYGDEYTILVTADHGGHDRSHGSELPEDMTIPQFYLGKDFEAGKAIPNVSLLDLAPTAATLLQVEIPREWEGKSLIG